MSDDRIMVMALKGTPARPDDEGKLPPAAFTVCCVCGKDLVYDARNSERIHAEGIRPYCADCAADYLLASKRPAEVQGMLDGKPSNRGVPEFLDRVADRAKFHRRPN